MFKRLLSLNVIIFKCILVLVILEQYSSNVNVFPICSFKYFKAIFRKACILIIVFNIYICNQELDFIFKIYIVLGILCLVLIFDIFSQNVLSCISFVLILSFSTSISLKELTCIYLFLCSFSFNLHFCNNLLFLILSSFIFSLSSGYVSFCHVLQLISKK